MAFSLGRAVVDVVVNTKKMREGFKKAKGKVSGFAGVLRGLGGAAKVATVAIAAFGVAAAGALAAVVVKSVLAASTMEETMNKFNVVFGENSEAVKEWADNYGKEVGRSKQQIAMFMASTQDLFVPLGFEAGAATEMSKQITKLAVDLASFNEMEDEYVLENLQAALTGSGSNEKVWCDSQ